MILIDIFVIQVENGLEIAKTMLAPGGFLLTVEFNINKESVMAMLGGDFDLVYQVQTPIQAICLWKLKTPGPGN